MNYNKIIESIKHGINLALDDFNFNDESKPNDNYDIIDTNEDEKLQFCKHIILPQIFNDNHKSLEFYYIFVKFKNDLNKFKNALKTFGLKNIEADILIDYLQTKNILYREYVDLDLPSGTLWCTENLDEMDYEFAVNGYVYRANEGSYYVWGNPKHNPLHSGGDKIIKLKDSYINALSKKCKNITIPLKLEDDAAYNVNKHYRIPTYDNFEELFKNINIIKLELDNYLQVLGYVLVSKKDPLKFIWFPYEKDRAIQLYLTSELTRLGTPDTYMHFAKLKQSHSTLIFGNQSYNVWQNTSIPGVLGRIRPIYIE